MDIIAQIIMYLLSFFQIFNFLFPSLPEDEPIPEEPTSVIVQETTTEAPDEPSSEEITTLPPVTECRHTGGKATCQKRAICSVCNEEYGELAEHSYNIQTIKPTCTEGGATYHTCRNCGDSYKDNEKPATGHSYAGTTIAADCENAGYTKYTCGNCGDSYETNRIPALGHNYIPVITVPDCENGGYTTHTCENCSDSYKDNEIHALGHSYITYTSNGDATCEKDGTKTATCVNGCGSTDTVADTGSMLPHTDENKDTYCDHGGEKLNIDFTHLTYPEEAVKTKENLAEYLARADKKDDLYASCQRYEDNGIIISPYYTAEIDGKEIPVYGTVTYSGTTNKGTLHSFSEIYVEKDEYCTFEIKIKSGSLGIAKAVVLPEAYGEAVTVNGSTVTAVLSGFGAHTFLFNDNENDYAYTVFVREEIDEEAEITALQDKYGKANVHIVDGYLENHLYTNFNGVGNQVIYLKKGSYVTAKHTIDIESDADNQSKAEILENGVAASTQNGISLNRLPFININGNGNVKILGYGVIDLTHLDRGERRGMVFAFASDIEIRGVKLINAPEWTVITYKCDTVDIKDVDIFGYRQNSDGFAICNSQNVTIDGCFVKTGDDAFCIKTLGGDENAITKNITVKNCYAWATKARAFGIFGETHKNMSDITFKDSFVLMHDATWDEDKIPAIGIVAEVCDGAGAVAHSISNVTFENIEISRNKSAAINVLIFDSIYNLTIKDITFRNIKYNNSGINNHIVNYGNSSGISNVTFDTVKCSGTLLEDANKTTYFKENSYHGGYINFK